MMDLTHKIGYFSENQKFPFLLLLGTIFWSHKTMIKLSNCFDNFGMYAEDENCSQLQGRFFQSYFGGIKTLRCIDCCDAA